MRQKGTLPSSILRSQAIWVPDCMADISIVTYIPQPSGHDASTSPKVRQGPMSIIRRAAGPCISKDWLPRLAPDPGPLLSTFNQHRIRQSTSESLHLVHFQRSIPRPFCLSDIRLPLRSALMPLQQPQIYHQATSLPPEGPNLLSFVKT